MTNTEINKAVLEIVGFKHCQLTCPQGSPDHCCHPKRELTAWCRAYKPPDFFAPNANPMPLIEWCIDSRLELVMGNTIDELTEEHTGFEVSICSWGKSFTNYHQGEFLAAALARAIYALKETQ